ncbi:MAG: DUF2889 domain-containing protein [Rhodocyclaceae bacterium]|nr:DUF2889 domain-containing protein [Rhodocyclaceae bacterium]MCB1963015.1 DUF2889 domain-containing protein [Rhodocyclaceae bacterium]
MADSPVCAPARRPVHSRIVALEGFLRDDGLVDIEARLTDVKSRDYPLASGLRKAGEPIHDLRVCVTIDDAFTIVAINASADAVPYPGACEAIAPAYGQLLGLNLLRGFRAEVKALFAGVAGCSHLTELLGAVPTAAIQTVASFRSAADEGDTKPFQLDRCHALETRGETVRRFYPRWYRR